VLISHPSFTCRAFGKIKCDPWTRVPISKRVVHTLIMHYMATFKPQNGSLSEAFAVSYIAPVSLGRSINCCGICCRSIIVETGYTYKFVLYSVALMSTRVNFFTGGPILHYAFLFGTPSSAWWNNIFTIPTCCTVLM